uniref:BTB domain-containing protein n=1 Tax=Ascaris lumbricoides TaxID=6252 RepID=A0A9J2PW25_ASCLU
MSYPFSIVGSVCTCICSACRASLPSSTRTSSSSRRPRQHIVDSTPHHLAHDKHNNGDRRHDRVVADLMIVGTTIPDALHILQTHESYFFCAMVFFVLGHKPMAMEPIVVDKSRRDKVLNFINNWKDGLRAEKWPDLFEDMMRIQSKDVGLSEDILSKVREAAVFLAIHLLPLHRDLLYYAAKEGRFEVMPTIALWCDNCHEQQHGQTPAYIAAMTSHVAAVCVLANRDKRVLYDRGPDGRTPYDILYSKFSTFLLTDSRSSPPGCLYTYGENMARSLGHIPGERIPKPRFLETTVRFVQNCEISLGRYHTLMLIDSRVYSCGLGRDWKLGHGNEADVVIPREVFLDDRKIVAVSAGLSHSVVCTEKEVIVFGRNSDGQLGLKESKATLPTVAFTLKAPHIEIMRCFAGATYSAVMTSNGRCIVAGRVPWPDMSGNYWSFTLPQSPLYIHRTVHFFDNFVVTLQRYQTQTKVEVLSVREGFCSRLQGQYDCKGVVESNMTILLRSALNVWKDPSFFVFYRHPHTRGLMFVELRFKNFSSTVFMNDIVLSTHGEFIAISKVNQVAALPPALRVFISADGRNKALVTCGISVDKFTHVRQPTSPTPRAAADKDVVEVACTDEQGKEMEVFLAQRDRLIGESEYCRSFFSRWCEDGDVGARISFVDDVHLVGDFLRYCEGVLQLNGFCESKLFDIMRFADRYMCQQLFDDALGAVLLLMPTVRNLYELSRSIANPKLNDCVDYLGALLLPLMLDLGLAQQLTPAELRRMEQQYSAFDPQSSSVCESEKFCRPIGNFVMELFKTLGALFGQLDEETIFKEAVLGFVLREENRLPKPRRQGFCSIRLTGRSEILSTFAGARWLSSWS